MPTQIPAVPLRGRRVAQDRLQFLHSSAPADGPTQPGKILQRSSRPARRMRANGPAGCSVVLSRSTYVAPASMCKAWPRLAYAPLRDCAAVGASVKFQESRKVHIRILQIESRAYPAELDRPTTPSLTAVENVSGTPVTSTTASSSTSASSPRQRVRVVYHVLPVGRVRAMRELIGSRR